MIKYIFEDKMIQYVFEVQMNKYYSVWLVISFCNRLPKQQIISF